MIDVTFLNSKLPTFYKDMLSFFDDLKTLYNCYLSQTVLFNKREILIKEARNSFHFPQTSFTNSLPNTVWFIVSV